MSVNREELKRPINQIPEQDAMGVSLKFSGIIDRVRNPSAHKIPGRSAPLARQGFSRFSVEIEMDFFRFLEVRTKALEKPGVVRPEFERCRTLYECVEK